LTDTSATLTIGADYGTIGTIEKSVEQLVTSPCQCFTMRLLTEFTWPWAL